MTKCARCGRVVEGVAAWTVEAAEGRTEAVCAACLATQTRPSFAAIQAEMEKMIGEADPPPFRSRVSWLTYLPNAVDENWAEELARAINAPSGLRRARGWIDKGVARDLFGREDPDMPLEDAEPGRYGWRS